MGMDACREVLDDRPFIDDRGRRGASYEPEAVLWENGSSRRMELVNRSDRARSFAGAERVPERDEDESERYPSSSDMVSAGAGQKDQEVGDAAMGDPPLRLGFLRPDDRGLFDNGNFRRLTQFQARTRNRKMKPM
jgi:hypothetical protein